MKKLILSAFTLALLVSSCNNNGEKVDAKDAENVEVIETESTVTLSTIDEASTIEWFASHLGGVAPRFGKIGIQSAEVLVNNGELSNATVIIDLNTLTVENFEGDEEQTNKLTGHLKSADFFNVEVNPTAKFELTSIADGDDTYNSKVTGNLTILDSTKSISFLANISSSNEAVSIQSQKFAIDRTNWGMLYHVEGSEGVPTDYLISNEVGFIISVNVK
ncbi:hypothetical protein DNU06_08320 [Putridiphycobacter roseus]|uniref:Lipid/polyisoprenoid-binding YceI-like domain-containing protein n=1 Tax=Putridiphycobacter roseus TaxID=2219161 RepID=A0A2W1MYK9_9FLAO|nr:YceI family protein [Putridiphycobacter roseus]PZE17269.1 hypothetical protein DNU06_08320 [Putridiphycobacter roseus]